MYMIRRFIGSIALITLLLTSGFHILAQDAPTPTPEMTEATAAATLRPEPVVVGDANAEALALVRQYLEENNTDLLAENVVIYDRTLLAPVAGRDLYLQSRADIYGADFVDFFFHPARYIVADNVIVVEFDLTGTASAFVETDPALTPASGDPALVDPAVGDPMMWPDGMVYDRSPMVGIFEVHDGTITRVDIFHDDAMTGAAYPVGFDPYWTGTAAGMGDLAGLVDLSVGNIVDEPERFVGKRVIVQGNVGRALSERSFVLYQSYFGGASEMLVINATDGDLGFVQLADTEVLVSGVVEWMDRADFEGRYGLPLDAPEYGEFDGRPVLLADNAVNLYDVATFGNIQDNPEAFYGQTVSITGDVRDYVSDNAFILEDRGLLNFNPARFLVLYGPDFHEHAGALPEQNRTVVVNGTVRQFLRADFEAEYGVALDEGIYAGYETLPVIVAEQVYAW